MKYSILIFIFFITTCKSTTQEIEHKEKSYSLANCPIPLSQGKIYGNYGKPQDTKTIFKLLEILLNDICEGNLNHVSQMVHNDLGLFIDAKGHWTKEEMLKEITDPNGYFAIYFFDQKALDQKKGGEGYLTIQNALKSSNGLVIDMYFDSSQETEVKIQFNENPKNARYLINPVFKKIDKDWILMRML